MNALEEVGRETEGTVEYVGGVAILLADAFRQIWPLSLRGIDDVFNQAFRLGVQSWNIVLLTALFTGMVFSLEAAAQAVAYGVGNLVGGAISYTTARELGPMLSAVVVAGRTGAAIAAELGSMVVTEQVEALRAIGLSPTRMLVVPRLLALMVTLPVLCVFADLISILGGMWIASTVAHIGYESFIVSARQALTFTDVLKGLLKSLVFGIIIAVIGSYEGLSTHGGAAGVGRSTTRAVVTAIILIFIANFGLSYALWGTGAD